MCKYEVADPEGRPRHQHRPGHARSANGTTEVTASYGDKIGQGAGHRQPAATSTCRSTSATRSCRSSPSSAATRGGCHGKASGQNGFKLSLLGFEPEVDYNALVKEARGRRLFPAAPDNSLLLLKATGSMAHGGGKRMEVGSDEYKLIRRWIAAGTALRRADRSRSSPRSRVYPEHRIMTRQQPAAVRRLRPLQRRHRRGRHPPGPVREQRHRRSPSWTAPAWCARWT